VLVKPCFSELYRGHPEPAKTGVAIQTRTVRGPKDGPMDGQRLGFWATIFVIAGSPRPQLHDAGYGSSRRTGAVRQ
jgi:hypothetical protein